MAENAGTSKLALARKNIVRFFKDIRTELKKVIWPTRQQLINNTFSVLLACFVIGMIIWIADQALDQIIRLTLAK
ncbi:MAG: preprotein translocase subunit SecE [Ruminiclostridium sp.]|nr:preprotein translocase subunit SecE [Ruminiclostridium sp.]